MKNIWFDVTEIQDWHGHYTGIQRVIFNIGKELDKTKDIQLKYCRFDRNFNVFVETNFDFNEHSYEVPVTSQFVSPEKTFKIRAYGYIKRKTPSRVKEVAKQVLRPDDNHHRPSSIPIHQGDILFTPGAFWTGFIDAVSKLKTEHKVHTVGVMYDLVPAVVPQYSAEVTVIQYEQELPKALAAIDTWFSISKSTKDDLIGYAKQLGVAVKSDSVHVIRLGADNNTEGSEKNPLPEDIKDFVLFVSTIEARKNQQLVYQVVKRAAEKGVNIPPVVLIGKQGWLTGDLIYTLQKDKSLNGKLIWLDRVDDKGLRWLYRNCKYTLYPSFYEGWGLPVAESLVYGKPCLATRVSSIPEVAGDKIDYFSPYSSDELLQLMNSYSDKKVFETACKRAKSHKTDSWQTTGKQVGRIIKGITKA